MTDETPPSHDHRPLQGRHALVTGASSGIGAATARALCRAGATVILTARRADRLSQLESELNAGRPGSASAATCDVRKASDLARIFDGERSAGRPVDLVVANAGLGLGVAPIQDGDPEDWSTMIDTNVKGVLHTIRAALPTLKELGRGDLVLLGSVAGRQVYPGGNVYNATKHAVKAIYDALRLDNVGSGLRFTTVDPGMVQSEFSVVRLGDRAQADAVYAGMEPLRPEDVADAILYAVTRPSHVNIGEIVLWPTDQASTRDVHRSN